MALVDHPVHGPSVCKVYRPGAQRYFERELRARTELADLPLIPGLLDHGENWLLTPFYSDDGRQVRRQLPFMTSYRNEVQLRPQAVRALVEFAKALHERGLFILDLTTENVFSDPRVGLKVLDLEFLQEYAEPVTSLSECYSFRGVPRSSRDRYDQPLDVPLTRDGVGNQVFHPAVSGLPVTEFSRSVRSAEGIRRTTTQLAWFLAFGVCRPIERVRGAAARSRWCRRVRTLLLMLGSKRRKP